METAPESVVDTALGAVMEIVEYVCASLLSVSLSLVLTLHLSLNWFGCLEMFCNLSCSDWNSVGSIMLFICPWFCFPRLTMVTGWCFFVRKSAGVEPSHSRGVTMCCVTEYCWQKSRVPTSRPSLQDVGFSRAKMVKGWCSCICDICMLNVVYFLIRWLPLLRGSGSCKWCIFILTLLGRRVYTSRTWALQCGRRIIVLSWVTMTDLIVLLCVGEVSNCRIFAGFFRERS
jgi:hypothetical protein